MRGVVLPLLDLRVFLGIESPVPMTQTKVMIVEFNDIRLGFLVDSVERIHQISAGDLDSSKMRGVSGKWVLYVVRRDERNILLLDYEAIIQATAPAVAQNMFDKSKLRCSAAKAAMFGLPRDLAGACAALGVPQQKDIEGSKLMLRLCKPRAARKDEKLADPDWEKKLYWHGLGEFFGASPFQTLDLTRDEIASAEFFFHVF